jgi:hypothetical protein
MISRTLSPAFLARAAMYPVLTLTGPRQSGKTTLCRMLFPEKPYLSSEFFQHLLSLNQGLGQGAVAASRLVYGGDSVSSRSGVEVWPWRMIQGAAWT